ncbi:hypothetical protein Tco_0550372 [Tanacetum coccineum]
MKPCSACSRVFMGDIYGDHAVSCAEVDIGLGGERNNSLRPADVLLYSWDVGRDVCVDLITSKGPKVVFGDDSSGDIKGYGSVNYNGITFTRVAYGTIYNQNNEVVLIAPRRRDVYVIDMPSFNKESNACFFAKASPTENQDENKPRQPKTIYNTTTARHLEGAAVVITNRRRPECCGDASVVMWCCYDDDDDELMMMIVMTAETARGGWGKERGGEWGSGLGRSKEEEHIWCSPEISARKVFRWPEVVAGGGGRIWREMGGR